MRPRRWLLLLASFASLIVLVYAGLSAAFSVPSGDQRAVAVPLLDPLQVPTLAQGGATIDGYSGAYLVIANESADFPSNAVDPHVVRALAYVPATNASTNLTLVGVPEPDGANGTRAQNLTVDAQALSAGKAGFLVKADRDADVRFVETARVVGEVARFESPASLWTLGLLGALGFAAPLVYLIVTHKGAAKRGMANAIAPMPGSSAALGVCRECGAPLAPGSDFCTRCGAWTDPKKAEA